MRKLIFATALAATLVPATAMAQSYGEVRQDQRDQRQDQRRLQQDRYAGSPRDVREDRRDLRQDRQETREDWRDYRRTHPEIYRGGGYVGPRAGWRYRPVAVGYRFDPVFYGQRYWVDPVRYRLPGAGPDQRWVRYGNDVALVNVRTGRVIAINGGFFL